MFQNQQQPNQQEQEEKAQRMAEMKNSILSQVLDQSARTRCESRIPDKSHSLISKPEHVSVFPQALESM